MSLLISLGFDDRIEADSYEAGPLSCLNAAALWREQVLQGKALETRLEAGMDALMRASPAAEPPRALMSNEPLQQDLRAALARGTAAEPALQHWLQDLVVLYTHIVRKRQLRTEAFFEVPMPATERWEPRFYARYGNVELRVIQNWIERQPELREALQTVQAGLDDANSMYAPRKLGRWLSADDLAFNLRALMTNAGFYADLDQPWRSLAPWCETYLAALGGADHLFPYPGAYPNFWPVQAHLWQRDGRVAGPVRFPAPDRFYAMLAGRKLLFVTPFADEIAGLRDSGRLFGLYKDLPIPDFALQTLPAPMSVYPQRPDAGWHDSFERLKQQVDEAFARHEFDLFFASCGCYGLPLTHHVHRTHGCAAVYYGNHLNTLLGVRQKCNDGFLPERRLDANWAVSRLGEMENLARIDGGRYA
ncbi:hypothetical protein LRH25_31020 [Ideonella azotifigens]|uniref:Uncharacterized protein n=1 Tax=Ideonella azotifigens TaxID=513160 RepID=A0ABN1KL03_9BURK|nr:hypothetical protein [Ideonella azotifigens]MCD2344757.1 hypothetical protein [Ideonella azotifigens]